MKEEALKLADELDELHQYVPSEAPAMIRRLVEELDEKNYRILELTKRYKALTWNDKQGEPVVWMYQDKSTHEVRFQKHMRGFVDHGKTYETPLYTAPQTKPLSDEEILNSWVEIDLPEECWITDEHLINFARAIEERHGIK